MSLDEKFNSAAASVKDMKNRPSDSELLELYALYKQATIGDCNIDQPGALDLKAKAKWEAWNGKKGNIYFTCRKNRIMQ
ncbi:putative acyl-CoA-binding protein like [Argiope bruennichi]|uniref:Putative acyl-CoA-binding protein like n=1 Tax=Argiope bruennichi TaxID=94029 RepID=A0A8T0EED1_ARGBR|nr:putative acyl-CoA-binding protein like [Argiope bruennichi]